jgi:hypothetical protein
MVNPLFFLAQYVPSNGLNNANDDTKNIGGTTTKNIFGGKDSIVSQVINILMYIIGIIAVIMLIVGGIMYATSAGDEAKAKKARGAIISGLLGLAFAILAWTLVNFVFANLGNS